MFDSDGKLVWRTKGEAFEPESHSYCKALWGQYYGVEVYGSLLD